MDNDANKKLFTISTPAGWGASFGRISGFLNCAVFAHPSCARLSLSYRFCDGQILATVEPLRCKRLPEFNWTPATDSRELAKGMDCNEKEAISLGRTIGTLLAELGKSIVGAPLFAQDWDPLLFMGRSERWDERHLDGLAREESGADFAQKAFFESAADFPDWTEYTATAGANLLHGESRQTCLEITAELQADSLSHDSNFYFEQKTQVADPSLTSSKAPRL